MEGGHLIWHWTTLYLASGVGHFPVKYGAQYQPKEFGLNAIPWQTAHSSYFLLLGELGFPGLIFIVGLIISNIVAGEQLLQQIRRRESKDFVVERHLVTALNASLIGFAVGGAFLSAAYYPHLYLLAALLECGRELSRKALVSTTSAAEEKIAVPRPIYQQASI